MPSDKNASREVLNERLAEARNSALLEGEEIIAQAQADQSQAVVLTKSRVLLLRVGLTATGELDGRIVNAYPLPKIKAVDVRKGPMGAVIHIVTDKKEASVPGVTPSDVIVFNDPKKTSACEQIAAEIQKAAGKPVSSPQGFAEGEHIEVMPEPPTQEAAVEETPTDTVSSEPENSGVERKSLAEQIYAETVSSEPVPQPVPEYTPESSEHALENSEHTPESSEYTYTSPIVSFETGTEMDLMEEPEDFGPNPNLPKPAKKEGNARHKVVAVVGMLTMLALAGVAVMSFKQTAPPIHVKIDVAELTKNMRVISNQYVQVSKYRDDVRRILQPEIQTSAGIRSAVGSGSANTITAALRQDNSSETWRELDVLEAPAGLAGAKESLTSGMFLRKNTLANVLNSAQSGSVDARGALNELAEADASIQKGLQAVDKMMGDLDAQVATLRGHKERR